jgi:hypothetical protein
MKPKETAGIFALICCGLFLIALVVQTMEKRRVPHQPKQTDWTFVRDYERTLADIALKVCDSHDLSAAEAMDKVYPNISPKLFLQLKVRFLRQRYRQQLAERAQARHYASVAREYNDKLKQNFLKLTDTGAPLPAYVPFVAPPLAINIERVCGEEVLR